MSYLTHTLFVCTHTLSGNVPYVLRASMYKYACSLFLCVCIVALVMALLGILKDQGKYVHACVH